mgnify:FL=1
MILYFPRRSWSERARATARVFVPAVNMLAVLVVASALVAAVVVWITAVHDARRARIEVCAAKVEAIKARVRLDIAGYYVLPADPCLALDVMAGRR